MMAIEDFLEDIYDTLCDRADKDPTLKNKGPNVLPAYKAAFGFAERNLGVVCDELDWSLVDAMIAEGNEKLGARNVRLPRSVRRPCCSSSACPGRPNCLLEKQYPGWRPVR